MILQILLLLVIFLMLIIAPVWAQPLGTVTLVGQYDTPGSATGVAVGGHYAYIGDGLILGPDFPIRHDEGYFARVGADGTWTPGGGGSPSAQKKRLTTKPLSPEQRLARLRAYPATPLAARVGRAASTTSAGVTLANLTPVSITVAWLTEQETIGEVAYGLNDQVDQMATEMQAGRVHWVELTGLRPETAYRIQVNGQTHTFTTPALSPGLPYTVFGRAMGTDGQPSVQALVTVWVKEGPRQESLPLAARTDSLGFWAVNLGNLKDAQGGAFAWQVGQLLDVEIVDGTGQARFQTPIAGESPQSTTVRTSVATGAGMPKAFALKQNFPNPFNPATTIQYEVPQAVHVTLRVYNLLGQEVVRLVDVQQAPGRYEVMWNGRNGQGAGVASGVYLYRMTTTTGFSQTRRMTLLR